MLGTIVPSLSERLALTNLQISYLALAQGIGLAATSVWAGALMEWKGKKLGVALGLCACIAGLLLLIGAQTFALSVTAMTILGVAGSLVIVGANAIVSEVSDERKASSLNVLNVFVGLGGMATPFIAGNLLHSDPKLIAYCGIGIAGLALTLTLAVRMKSSIHEQVIQRDKSAFSDPRLYLLSFVTFLYTACEFGIWNWLPRFLIASGLPSSMALNILSLGFGCGILLGRLGAAKLLQKASPFGVTLACSFAMCATTFTLLQTSAPALIALVVFLAGIAMSPIFPTTIAIVATIFKQRASTAIGFAITCGFSGLVLSSPVIGKLSGPDPRGIGRGLLLLPALSLVIAIALLLFRKDLISCGEAKGA